MYDDTISAISTPPGEGGIGIVRLSGARSREIAKKIFTGKLRHRHLAYGRVINPDSGDILDEALVALMLAPNTYTREDMVEINCHGGPLVLQSILELVLKMGARLAMPGEFTLRAFLNGRIDLSQAEAVIDIIKARTGASLKIAISGLEGNLSKEIKTLRNDLMESLAYLTAIIDFPEDEIEQRDIGPHLERVLKRIRELISGAGAGIIYREGLKTAIVGRPNAGKSSLLNRLLRSDRAIVTPIPGTTRDTLEEAANIRGLPLVLIDTAGITHSHNTIESLGIERTHKAISQADLVLWVTDASESLQSQDYEIMALLDGKKVLTVVNKIDLPVQINLSKIKGVYACICALTGQGLDELEEKIINIIPGIRTSEKALVSHTRHKDALARAEASLSHALAGLKQGTPEDMVALDVSEAIDTLGEITGETVREDLLDAIFRNFCIGK